MQSNRELFQEMREQEAQELPVIEREQPKQPTRLEQRANAYERKVLKNRIKKFGLDHVLAEINRKRTDVSELDTRPQHNHAKPLTDYQKLRHIATYNHKEYDLPTTEDIKESFKTFKKSRGI